MAKTKLNFSNPLLATKDPIESVPTERSKAGRPADPNVIHGDDATKEGLQPELTRFSVICKEANIKDLRDYAYTKRITLKDATDEIIEFFFKAYRKDPKNEPLLEDPKTRKGTK